MSFVHQLLSKLQKMFTYSLGVYASFSITTLALALPFFEKKNVFISFSQVTSFPRPILKTGYLMIILFSNFIGGTTVLEDSATSSMLAESVQTTLSSHLSLPKCQKLVGNQGGSQKLNGIEYQPLSTFMRGKLNKLWLKFITSFFPFRCLRILLFPCFSY